MIRSRWNKKLSGAVAVVVVLIGGLVLANYGGGVAPAEAHDQQKQSYNHPNPFKQILDKLNDVLEKLKNGGGGGAAGNYTSRWDTNNTSLRFTTAFPGAVLDNNTGLVWEQAPSTIMPAPTWTDARTQCLNKAIGGTRGWRLPSVVELASVIDASPGAPIVSVVFAGVQVGNVTYWSATTNAGVTSYTTNNTLNVSFADGSVGVTPKGSASAVWCVRGPMSESVY
jgi:prepilin-type processing-associated H-X9-DG protein